MQKFSALFLAVICFLLLGSSVAFGATNDDSTGGNKPTSPSIITISIIPSDQPYMEKVWDSLGTDGSFMTLSFSSASENTNTDTRLMTYDKRSGVLSFHDDNFRSATEKSRKKALGIFIENLQSSKVSKNTQDSIMQYMTTANDQVARLMVPLMLDKTSADLYTASRWINPFLPVVRVVLGVLAILVFLVLMIYTACDLVFIGIPFARERIMQHRDDNGGKGKISFISNDAESVVRETEASLTSTGGYQNPYWLYLKRRSTTFIVLSITMLYLIVGELGGVIAWLLKLVSGVV